MTPLLLLTCLMFGISSCNWSPAAKTPTTTLDAVLDAVIEVHDNVPVEFPRLYGIEQIRTDTLENIILQKALEKRGFELFNWGRGNWQEGPRIVSAELTNTSCTCVVTKRYYSLPVYESGHKTTEQIQCR